MGTDYEMLRLHILELAWRQAGSDASLDTVLATADRLLAYVTSAALPAASGVAGS
jgi:hypothetical protein